MEQPADPQAHEVDEGEVRVERRQPGVDSFVVVVFVGADCILVIHYFGRFEIAVI